VKPIPLIFAAYNLLVTLPLKFLTDDQDVFKTSFTCSVLFTLAWFVIYQIIFIGRKRNVDGIALTLGATIGVKFFFTGIIFGLLFFKGVFDNKVNIAVFLASYAIYTIAIAYFSNRQMNE
jgi:hypothetical protein